MTELHQIICEIKKRNWTTWSMIGEWQKTAFSPLVERTVSIPELTTYVVERDHSKYYKLLIGQLVQIALVLVVTTIFIITLYQKGHFVFDFQGNWLETIAVIFFVILLVAVPVEQINTYRKERTVLQISESTLVINDSVSVLWKDLLTVHFIDARAKSGPIQIISLHYLDNNNLVTELRFDPLLHNYDIRQICSMLAKYYLYETVLAYDNDGSGYPTKYT